MSTMEVKICGVNGADFAVEAERLGADYLGFVFAAGSPRRVTADFVREVRRRLQGSSRCVGVFTSAAVPEVAATVQACGLDVVQLHRRALAREVEMLKAGGWEVWTLAGGAAGDGVLFDSSHGDGEKVLRRGNWKCILAGGITAANVGRAVALGPEVIDVSGSLESARGVKSVAKLREFMHAFEAVGK